MKDFLIIIKEGGRSDMQSNSATRYEDDYSQITFCKESNPASSWTYHSVACTVTVRTEILFLAVIAKKIHS